MQHANASEMKVAECRKLRKGLSMQKRPTEKKTHTLLNVNPVDIFGESCMTIKTDRANRVLGSRQRNEWKVFPEAGKKYV